MRRPCRPPETETLDPLRMPLALALEHETSETWPSRRDRRAFWGRSDVPKELRNAAEPDPRPVLTHPQAGPEIRLARSKLEGARLAWLREVAR